MTRLSDEDVRELLKESLPAPAVEAPRRDGWPAVRRMIARAPERPSGLEYALIAAVVLLCLFQPSLIQFLLLHL